MRERLLWLSGKNFQACHRSPWPSPCIEDLSFTRISIQPAPRIRTALWSHCPTIKNISSDCVSVGSSASPTDSEVCWQIVLESQLESHSIGEHTPVGIWVGRRGDRVCSSEKCEQARRHGVPWTGVGEHVHPTFAGSCS